MTHEQKPDGQIGSATRRAFIAGAAALPLVASAGSSSAAKEPERLPKIYGVYTGKDMKSYLCELTVPEGATASIPVYRLLVSGPLPPPTWQDLHVSTFWGSVTVIIAGELEIGVSAGALRSVVGKAGDIFVLVDTQGDGHTAARRGKTDLHQVNLRLKEPWLALEKGFKGWPDNVLPPKEYTPQVNF